MRSQKGRWTRRSLEISSDSSHSAILHLRGFPGVPNCTSQEEHSSLHQHMYFGCWFTVLTKRAYCWGDIPRGAKGATHSPVRMEWAALTDCYIFFVCKQLQWFFSYVVKTFADITSTLEKCPWGNMKITYCSDCRPLLCIFLPCVYWHFPWTLFLK